MVFFTILLVDFFVPHNLQPFKTTKHRFIHLF
jgi:hypothetical protein